MGFKILDSVTANSTGDVESTIFTCKGSNQTVCTYGTFDSCLIQLKLSPDNGTTWITPSSTDYGFYSADVKELVGLKAGLKLGAAVSTAGASTDVNAEIF